MESRLSSVGRNISVPLSFGVVSEFGTESRPPSVWSADVERCEFGDPVTSGEGVGRRGGEEESDCSCGVVCDGDTVEGGGEVPCVTSDGGTV